MLKLRFFASIRERVGSGEMCLPFAAECASVATLVETLDTGPVPGCRSWLLSDNTIVAVNQVVSGPAQALSDGDEVAFFPPVTGG